MGDMFFDERTPEERAAQTAAYEHEYGGASEQGPAEFRQRLMAAQRQQMGAAKDLYAHAGDAATLRGGQLRGDLGGRMIGEMRSGNAIAARQGQVVGSRALAGAAGDVGRMGSEARLGAADQVMGAQAMRAQYEQAVMDDYLTRMQAWQQAKQRMAAALQASQEAREEGTQQVIGAGIGALGAGVGAAAGMMGSGGGYGGGSGYRGMSSGSQYTSPGGGYGSLGAYANAPGGYAGGGGLGRGSDYYASAYGSIYGGQK